MKRILLVTTILFCVISAKSQSYVTVTDQCPVVTFTDGYITKIATYKKNVKIQLSTSYVYVTFTNQGNQQITWNSTQAYAYGGRTLTQLYNYILSILQEPC